MIAKGKFIVFEGCDGSGKSTQAKLLAQYLRTRGVKTVITGEPTDSPIGALLRACLSGRVETDEHTIAALFAADRLDHIHNRTNGIAKRLGEGVTVICDRFYFSSFAYNGGFVPLDWVIALNTPAMEELVPDLTLFIDVSPEEGMERIARRGETDRYETLERQRRIRSAYLDLFDRFRGRENVRIVSGEKEKELTEAHIRAIADELFGF